MSFPFADSPLFEMARRGRRLPHIVIVFLVLLGLLVVAFVPLSIVGEIVYADQGGSDAMWDNPFFFMAMFLLMTLTLWGWLALYEKRPFWTLGFPAACWFKKLLIGYGLGFGMMAVVVGLMYIAGAIELDTAGGRAVGSSALGSVILFFVAYLVQGSTEEIVIRGWLLQVIGARYRPITGVIVSSIIFVAFHGSIKPMVVLNLILFTVFLLIYCLRDGDIWGICGWHSAWNWAQNNFFGLELTGLDSATGTVVNLNTKGSALLSGGGFGPEASIMCTAVLLAGIIILLLMSRRAATATAPSAA